MCRISWCTTPLPEWRPHHTNAPATLGQLNWGKYATRGSIYMTSNQCWVIRVLPRIREWICQVTYQGTKHHSAPTPWIYIYRRALYLLTMINLCLKDLSLTFNYQDLARLGFHPGSHTPAHVGSWRIHTAWYQLHTQCDLSTLCSKWPMTDSAQRFHR